MRLAFFWKIVGMVLGRFWKVSGAILGRSLDRFKTACWR